MYSAEEWCEKAENYRQEREWDLGIDCCNEAVKVNSECFSAWNLKANLLFQKGDNRGACKAVDRALTLNKNDASAWVLLASIFIKEKEHDKALGYVDFALQLDESSASAWYFKGILFYLKGKWNEALNYIGKALDLRHPSKEILIYKSNMLMHLGRYDEAIKCIEIYINTGIEVNHKYAWVIKGIVYRKMGLYDAALSCFDKVLAKDENYISALKEIKITKAEKSHHSHFNIAIDLQSCTRRELPIIRPTDLRCGSRIASGFFGDVYNGIWEARTVAIKKYRENYIIQLDYLDNESVVTSQLQHPNIAVFYGSYFGGNDCYIVMECCVNGNLFQWLRTEEASSWPLRIRIARQIAEGLNYIHDCHVVHTDLNSTQVLLDESLTAKITGFGLARINSLHAKTEKVLAHGSFQWFAPELLRNDEMRYTKETDMYSFGVVVWEITARKAPFKDVCNNIELYRRKVAGEKETILPETPYSMAELIRKCWTDRAERRPTAKEAIALLQDNAYMDKTNAEPIHPDSPPSNGPSCRECSIQ